MKKITVFLAALFCVLQMSAVPAKPVKRTLVLKDGTTVTAALHGDEHFHFYVTDDQLPIMQRGDGSFELTDHSTVSRIWSDRRNARMARRAQAISARRNMSVAPRREFGVPGRIVGEKRGLVILVNFTDKAMKHTQQEFNNQFNEEGYSQNRHIGSVRDYFKTQSYGQLTIDFDVVGPYTVDHNMSYYGANDSQGNDLRPEEMIVEACKLADAEVDFKNYDWDGDNEVDQVFVVYAGFGEAQGAPSNTIWPHEWNLSEVGLALILDNVLIDTYACSNELHGTSGTTMDGIGAACHEFTHCLGIPDMYDTAYKGNFGMNQWDLMDSGSYNGPSGYDGSIPAAYTAYERWFSGWLEPTVLDAGANIKDMPAITDEPVCYVVYNQRNRNEYYLLQNVQKKSWNSYVGGHGMIVQHVYYNKSIWQYNEVNTTSNTMSGNQYQRCTIIAADNTYTSYSLGGDPFPGTSRKTALTNTSTPAATLYVSNSDNKKFLNRPIEDITESNGMISFTFNGGVTIEAPVANEVAEADMGTNWFRASWNEVDNALYYNVEVTEYIYPEEEEEETDPVTKEVTLLLSEDFSGLADYKGTLAIDSKLDTYLQTEGWTGTKVYSGTDNTGVHGIKLGNSSTVGTLTTPQIQVPSTGTVTLLISTEAFGSDALSLQVDVIGLSAVDEVPLASQTFTEAGSYIITVPNVTSLFKVTMKTTSKRAYIGVVKVADGEYTLDDMTEGSAVPVPEVQTVVSTYTVTDGTELLLSDLAHQEYSFRVQAVDAGDNKSEWSNTVRVVLPESPETAVECIPAIETSDRIQVYSLSGLLLKSNAASASWSQGLPHGTYILRSGTRIRKVVK